MLLLGGFIAYGVVGSALAVIYGTKTEAKIIAIDKVKKDYEKFGTPMYSNYPVLQFPHKDKLLKITDKRSDVNEDKVNSQLYIYYSEKYGVSRGFSAFEIVFSVMSICFIFGGSVMMFKRNELYLS